MSHATSPAVALLWLPELSVQASMGHLMCSNCTLASYIDQATTLQFGQYTHYLLEYINQYMNRTEMVLEVIN
jgi:hypothetical protein